MGIKIGMGFERTSTAPVDESLTLSKAQMLAIDDNKMPDKYFAVCLDDGKMYVYDKNATPNAETGKFTVASGGEAYDDTALAARVTANENALGNMYTKAEVIEQIEAKLGDFDKLDYKVADSAPTATKVVIDGVEVDVVEGTRYLVQDATEDRFEEYVVLDGVVYDLGPAQGSGTADIETQFDVSNAVGRYSVGDNIAAGTPIETVIKNILTKVSVPTLTPPSANLAYSKAGFFKVGANIPSDTATLTFSRGSITPQYTAESEFRSGEATEYSIELTNADTSYSDSNLDGAAFTVPAFTKSSKGVVTLTGTVNYGAGVQPKDSDGNNYDSPLAAGSKTATKTLEFILPFVYGVSSTATITDFTGLTEDLTTKKANKESYKFTTVVQHPVIAYDSAYGDLASILDQNGFETISGWTASTLTVDGQSYKVYVHNNATTDTNASYKFYF